MWIRWNPSRRRRPPDINAGRSTRPRRNTRQVRLCLFLSHSRIEEERRRKKEELPRYRSIVSHVFDGQLESTVECLTCHHLSRTTETFQVAFAFRETNPDLQDLSLSIPNREQLNRQASHVDSPPVGNSLRKKPTVGASLSLSLLAYADRRHRLDMVVVDRPLARRSLSMAFRWID
jgi:hypothetical protein